VRISKEIQEFASGKDAEYAWDKPKVTAALTIEQKEILDQRGVLSPEEVHRLASKMGAGDGQPICHSDVSDAERAKTLQQNL
jgi:phosphomethylpyrimidine synthase